MRAFGIRKKLQYFTFEKKKHSITRLWKAGAIGRIVQRRRYYIEISLNAIYNKYIAPISSSMAVFIVSSRLSRQNCHVIFKYKMHLVSQSILETCGKIGQIQ